MINIMKEHMARYPRMQIRDMLKLIYQSEFGGGHMIKDKNTSLEWIKKEHEFVLGRNLPERACICEDIGDGMCRVYLECLCEGLATETLNEMFVLSANTKTGNVSGLEEKLHIFLELCERGELPFYHIEAKKLVDVWKAQGYPALHHSEVFRKNYFPAYRVVLKKYAERLEVFQQIDRFLKNCSETDALQTFSEYGQTRALYRRSVVIAIDGMAGAGKSVLGQLLSEIYHCNLFHMDDFFLQPHQRTTERLAEPGGNVDYERFKTEVLDRLSDKEGLLYQPYDCSTQSLAEKMQIPYCELNIIEGAYSLHPYFEGRADLAFFMEISDEIQMKRIRKRNGEWLLKRFVEEWIPMEHKYFEAFRIKERAIVLLNE